MMHRNMPDFTLSRWVRVIRKGPMRPRGSSLLAPSPLRQVCSWGKARFRRLPTLRAPRAGMSNRSKRNFVSKEIIVLVFFAAFDRLGGNSFRQAQSRCPAAAKMGRQTPVAKMPQRRTRVPLVSENFHQRLVPPKISVFLRGNPFTSIFWAGNRGITS
jgi:hypothetical protein